MENFVRNKKQNKKRKKFFLHYNDPVEYPRGKMEFLKTKKIGEANRKI
jgi:hypothetical protein